MRRLSQAPKWLVGGLIAAILLTGLLAPSPWGPIAMSLVTLFLVWLLLLAWPVLDTQRRAVRTVVALGAAAMVFFRATGRL
jgi:hypothetical protein